MCVNWSSFAKARLCWIFKLFFIIRFSEYDNLILIVLSRMAQFAQEEVPHSYQVWYLTSISYKNNKTWTCLISSNFVLKIIQIIYSVFMYLFIYTPQRVPLNYITILSLLAVSIIIKHTSFEKKNVSFISFVILYIWISINDIYSPVLMNLRNKLTNIWNIMIITI